MKPLTQYNVPDDFILKVDKGEQRPYLFEGLKQEKVKLEAGDYTAKGLEKEIGIERKSPTNLLSCIGTDRKAFEGQLVKLSKLNRAWVLIEDTTQEDIRKPALWGSKLTTETIIGTLTAIECKYGVFVHYEKTRWEAEAWTLRVLLYYWHKKRIGEL